MAIVPQETANAPVARADTIGSESDLMTGIGRLTVFRQVILMVGLAASVALGLWVVLWLQEPSYQPLMQDIAAQDMEEVTSILNLNDVKYKIEPRTGMLLVSADQVHQAKMKMGAGGGRGGGGGGDGRRG